MKRIVSRGQTTIGIVGVLGTLTCMGAMLLAVIGVAGVGTSAAMAGMSTGSQTTSSQHPGLPAASRTDDPARLHRCVRPVPHHEKMDGRSGRPAGGWRHLLGDVRPVAPARDVRHDGAWPARLGRHLPVGSWAASQENVL
jgi:hypothetical protein